MTIPIKPIPEGFHTVTPYLIVKGAVQAIDFYQNAFDAKERFRMMGPDGKSVGHAEITIGDSIVMLADERPSANGSPAGSGMSRVSIALYVEDVDATFKRAMEAGAREARPVKDQFYGDRSGSLVDPFGHEWHLMTHIEDVSEDEVKRRMAEMCAQPASAPVP
jgi:PhnB protein